MTDEVTSRPRRRDTFGCALILCGVLSVAQLAATALVWRRLPAEIASRWSSLGQPIGHSGQALAWFTPALSVLMLAGLALSARHAALSRRDSGPARPLVAVVVAAVVATMAYGQGVLLAANRNRTQWEDAVVPSDAILMAPLAPLVSAVLLIAVALRARRRSGQVPESGPA